MIRRTFGGALPLALLLATTPVHTAAQETHALDTLVARARAANPTLLAARHRVEAALARIEPAGALPDPMLTAGVMNLPVSDPGFDDFMTMKTVGVSQRLPYPRRRSLARRAAELDARAEEARAEAVLASVEADVRIAYYDLVLVDRSIDVVTRRQALLLELAGVTEARYGAGTGSQTDLLKARVESARLAEDAVGLHETRRARLARLNALLDRPGDSPVDDAAIPSRIADAAVSRDPARIRFVSDRIGARAADSPLPTLEVLQERATAASPELRAHEAAIAAQETRVELGRRAHLPDFDISVQYGQRANRTDMASIMVSVPLPVRRGSRQDHEVAGAEAELASMRAEHHAMVNRLSADVAAAHADVERARAVLALFVRSILPQGRAALESALGAYPVGGTDLLTVLDQQATLFDYELEYHRALTDFAKAVAELERITGAEVLP